MDLNDIHFVDEVNGWIVGEGGSIIRTTDGGNTWDWLYRETTDNIKQVTFINNNTGWIIAGCDVIKTETGGGEICLFPAPVLNDPYDYKDVMPGNVTLSWYPVTNATSYRLQVSKSIGFSDPVFDEEELTSTSQIISDLDTGMTYYWRVNASNDTITSSWSLIREFTIYEISLTAPVLSSPPDSSVDNAIDITLLWNESGDADKYYLQVDDNQDFSSPLVDYEIYFSTSENVNDLDNSTTYYWRVKALNYSGQMSPWSDVWEFTTLASGLDAPLLSSPENGSTGQPVMITLIWNSGTGAYNYRLQVDDNPDFGSPVFDENYIYLTTQLINDLENNTTYYWRVKASDLSSSSPWSGIWEFTTVESGLSAPVLSTPEDSSTSQPVIITLMWNSVTDASSYHLQVDNTFDFTSPVFNEDSIYITSQQINGLENNTTYYWRVKASDESSKSTWSDIWEFTTVEAGGLAVPTLLSPPKGSTDQPVTITLSWNSPEGATSYQLQVDENSNFSSPLYNLLNITVTSREISGLNNNTTYYWKVNASNNEGVTSQWSEIWNFTTMSSVGLDEFNSDIQYKLYPNPVGDILFVEGLENELTNVSILSTEGKLFKNLYGKGISQIDVSDLQNGLYLIKIVNSKGVFITRIVKQ